MDIALLMLAVMVGFLFYMAPTCVASNKKHFKAILALNLLLGWTFIGWVAALVWALASPKNDEALLRARDEKLAQFKGNVPFYITAPIAVVCLIGLALFIYSLTV